MSIRIGIIGFGRSGTTFLNSIPIVKVKHPKIQVSMISSLDANDQHKISVVDSSIQWCGDYRTLIDSKNVDMIINCTNIGQLFKINQDILQDGQKHLLTEKPGCNNIEHMKTLVQLAQKAEKMGQRVRVNYNRRFFKDYLKMRTEILNGRIGDLEYIDVVAREKFPQSYDYLRSISGLFDDMGVHGFDLINYFTGSTIESIHSRSTSLIDAKIKEIGLPDHALASFRLTNGVIGTLHITLRAAYGYDQRIEILGSKGLIVNENPSYDNVQYWNSEGRTRSPTKSDFMEYFGKSFSASLSGFIDIIKGNKVEAATLEDALNVLKASKAAQLSLTTGREQFVEDLGQ